MSYFFNKFYRPGTRHPHPPPPAPEIFSQPALPPAGLPPGSRPGAPAAPQETSRSVASARARVHEQRWQSMRHDKDWYTYNDLPRRYSPSDYTGYAKKMLG